MYRFFHGDLPREYQHDYETSLFNLREHRLLQRQMGWHSFFLAAESAAVALAEIHFCVDEGIARSPYRSPFGGCDHSQTLRLPDLIQFMANVEEELKRLGVKRCSVKMAARPAGTRSTQETALLERGFRVEMMEKSTYLPLQNSFEERLYVSELGRLKKSIKHNFVGAQMPLSQWRDVFQFIKHCHEAKNFKLSMTEADVDALVQAFPERIHLFAVTREATMAAASFCVRTSQSTVFDFFHNHDVRFNEFSPVILLMKCMHNNLAQVAQWIDMGTSMNQENVNEGLYAFKLRMGGKPYEKLTLVKDLT